MRNSWIIAACIWLAPIPALAQTPTIRANAPITVAVTHDGVNTTNYRFYVDGVLAIGVPFSARSLMGEVRAVLPPMVVGTHLVEVTAANDEGESPRVGLSVNATDPLPVAPTNLRIVVVTSATPTGTVFRIESIAPIP